MLTIQSTHLVIISYGIEERIIKFIEQCNLSQLTVLLGNHLGDLITLSQYYLPKSTIDRITDRQSLILEKRSKAKEYEIYSINSEEKDE